MNKFRTLENIIRDIAAGRSVLSEKMGVMGTIRKGLTGTITQPKVDTTVIDPVVKDTEVRDQKFDGKPAETPTIDKVLTPGTPEHKAHLQHAARAQRKLKIIDNA